MVNIVNCLLTRKCNLACSYCQISGNIDTPLKPNEYPSSQWYFKNEKDTSWWVNTLTSYWSANKDVFFILYGGEPFVRWELLADVVNHLNSIGAHYTIISSCNEGIKKNIYRFFERVSKVEGFTASIDPGFYLSPGGTRKEIEDDEIYKSNTGYATLLELMRDGLVKDPVAEITCDCNTIKHLPETIRRLTKAGIVSDITFLDLAKNNYYDFSNITNPVNLVHPTEEVKRILKEIMDDDTLKVHMKEYLIPKIFESSPANMDCEIEKDIHNVTIDADGALRLCLRIRGRHTTKFSSADLFDVEGNKTDKYTDIHEAMTEDKKVLCKRCMWSCMLMSKSGDCDGIINH